MNHSQHHRGFTYIELMVVITIIAVITMMVLPAWRDNDRASVMAATQVLISDIETAQVMTIAVPEDPICVRFDTANNRYWLAPADDPENPILRTPSNEPYIVTLGQGRAVGAAGVALAIDDCPDDTIVFNADGGLLDFTKAPIMTLSIGDDVIFVVVAPTTGTVIESTTAPTKEEPEEEDIDGELLAGTGETGGTEGTGGSGGSGGGGLLGGLIGGLLGN